MSLGGGRQQHITLASRQISLSCRSSLSNAFRGINISGIWSAGLRLFFTCHGIHIELTGKCSDDDCSCPFVEISPTSLFISQSVVFVVESYTVTCIDFPGRQGCKKLSDFIGRRDCSVWNSRLYPAFSLRDAGGFGSSEPWMKGSVHLDHFPAVLTSWAARMWLVSKKQFFSRLERTVPSHKVMPSFEIY